MKQFLDPNRKHPKPRIMIYPMTKDYSQIAGTPARSKPRDCLHDVRDVESGSKFLDQTIACPQTP